MDFKLPEMPLPKFDLPKIPKIDPEVFENPNLASAFRKRIVEMINDFERDLDDEHEVGIRLVSFGQTVQFHIEDVGYYNPSLIIFYGRLDNGARVELVQHVSQISFLLMALPKLDESKPARRIGFNPDEDE
jgi:hypothetical protein